MEPMISLQLWSVQEACEEDFLGTLTKVKEFGYDGVEFAGYYGLDADVIKEHLDKLGLKVSGSHIAASKLKEDLAGTIEFEKKIGNNTIIIPWIESGSKDKWEENFAFFNEIQPVIESAGMLLSYHNHSHEFTEITNFSALEEMLKSVPKMKLEVDTYWVNFAGEDTLEWLENYKKYIDCLHIKDAIKLENDFESTELGKGILPLKEYAKFGADNQLRWLVIEQEAFQELLPMESAAYNQKVLRTILKEV